MAAFACIPTISPNYSTRWGSVLQACLVYQPVLLAVVEDGRILLEVHRDIYNKGIDPAQTVRDMAEAYGLSHDIDWPAVDAVIAAQDGLAREVGRLAPMI